VRFGLLATSFGNAQSVLIDRQNRVWAGGVEGLFLSENENFRKILPKKENVIALWESPADGNVWVGTFGNGVFVVSPAGKILKHLTAQNGLDDGNVLSIAGDGRRVWLATFGGVTAVDLNTYECTRLSELGNGYVYKVFPDSRGRVWFGTDGQGLIVLENNQFRHFTEANGRPLKTIYSVTEDRQGNIWFSTDKDRLFRYDGQNFHRLGTENHLHSLAITGLATDGNGNIVIAYDDGVDILIPDRSDHVTFCDAAIGAPDVEVNLNALCRDARGNVWLGTRQGILRVSAFDEPFMDDPQPGITAVSVFSEAVDFLSNNAFSHDQNYFIFNFTGLWYTDPESVRYRYRLEGFDPDWKLSKDHLASYPNLPPGRYTFRVQTSEHGNFDSVPEATWSFVIRSPIWAQWWFVALCLAAAVGLFYAYVSNREKRLQREAQLKREMVESQFAALKSQINPHFLFNSFNTLITIIEENPKIAVEYVEHLSDFYRSIIAYRERDFISLQEEMDLVRSFDFLLKKRYEDGFRLEDRLNGHTGFIMPLALQMLVENAVKHNIISASKPLTIEIFAENDGYVVVRNNVQPKIKPEPSTHFGLQSLVSRYQLLGERPVVVEDNAAFFTVKVPIKV
jgi:streptogramin lyase